VVLHVRLCRVLVLAGIATIGFADTVFAQDGPVRNTDRKHVVHQCSEQNCGERNCGRRDTKSRRLPCVT
jgi:hypothetical protein